MIEGFIGASGHPLSAHFPDSLPYQSSKGVRKRSTKCLVSIFLSGIGFHRYFLGLGVKEPLVWPGAHSLDFPTNPQVSSRPLLHTHG